MRRFIFGSIQVHLSIMPHPFDSAVFSDDIGHRSGLTIRHDVENQRLAGNELHAAYARCRAETGVFSIDHFKGHFTEIAQRERTVRIPRDIDECAPSERFDTQCGVGLKSAFGFFAVCFAAE